MCPCHLKLKYNSEALETNLLSGGEDFYTDVSSEVSSEGYRYTDVSSEVHNFLIGRLWGQDQCI